MHRIVIARSLFRLLPLEGVRVVRSRRTWPGPVAAEILAHMGADVIKIERPE